MAPTATKSASTFRLETSVSVAIKAKPETIWKLLTDAAKFPSWNSTVTSIDVEFQDGKVDSIRDFRYVPYIAAEALFEPV